MQAKKINLKDYDITVLEPNEEGEPEEKVMPFDVKKSIEGVMLAAGPQTQQRLSMAELLRNARIAQKITMSKDGFVLLEDKEFQIVKQSFNAFRGFGIFHVELCKRIDNAETVEVEEKKGSKGQ